MDDPIARLRAEADQAREGAREYAGTLWSFHSSLRDEGFTPDEALMLTQTFLIESLRSGDDE